MRPKALFWFDVFFFIALALYLIRTAFALLTLQAAIMSQPIADPYSLPVAAAISTLIIGGQVAVWFLVSRRRQQKALWLWAGIAVFSLMGLPKAIQAFLLGQLVVGDVLYDVFYFGALIGTLAMLLRSSTRAWLAGK